MQINYHLNWKSHINLILPKLYTTSFALICLFYVLNIDAVWIVDVAYFYSMIKNGIILGGNSTNTGEGFLSQKRIIRTIVGVECTNLCRGLVRNLTFYLFLFVFSLIMFVYNNLDCFQTNCNVM